MQCAVGMCQNPLRYIIVIGCSTPPNHLKFTFEHIQYHAHASSKRIYQIDTGFCSGSLKVSKMQSNMIYL